jgi:hypothetical protein
VELPDFGKTWNNLRWNYLILAKHGIASGGTTLFWQNMESPQVELHYFGKTWNHLRWNYLIMAKHGITSGETT